MDEIEAFNDVVAAARQSVEHSASACAEELREACNYVEYVSAKLQIEEMPLTFSQWQDCNG